MAVFLDLGIVHVLLNVGHHVFGAIASIRSSQTVRPQKRGVTLEKQSVCSEVISKCIIEKEHLDMSKL
ncbi:hypothetical protein QG37_06287 [Candidozyma auris]|uniref:Uncharacterized protein n=1 Tax=Candidozyma auris TaxID=498019 RepID=A0A0L0NTG6_CANAR|nr:hypothetical protein QG37_06287 [[Candida] auris]